METVTRSIAPLVGRRIVAAEFRCLRVLRGGDPDEMAARLAGRKIAGVKRYGKFILMSIRGGGYLTIHLGMTGQTAARRRAGQAYARHPDARPRRPAVRRQPPVRPPAVQRGVSGAHRKARSGAAGGRRSRTSPTA